MERVIAHLDLDTFFVSCERLTNSKFNGIPLIIGAGDRGMVASCSYEARTLGLRSAMPMKMAKMPFIADPRYPSSEVRTFKYKAQQHIKEVVSMPPSGFLSAGT